MQLTPEGTQIVANLAQRYGLSVAAVTTMLQAVMLGGGNMAQFNHPELGGSGQWMRGGMTMVGDMFNHALKARVDSLCHELAGLLASEPLCVAPAASQSQSQNGPAAVSLFVSGANRSGSWWPADLGAPSATGTQNQWRYAIFPAARCLAIDLNGQRTLYDTLDHQISGVGQQQAGDASFTFTSQHGLVRVADLPVMTPTVSAPEPAAPAQPAVVDEPPAVSVVPSTPPPSAANRTDLPPASPDDGAIFAKIEGLALLHQKGILTEEEYATKKAELLSRL